MKKIVAMILAAALVLSLAACGSGTSSTPTTAPASAPKKAEAAPAADSGSAASNWPTDTVSMYVPAKAGGGTDMIARLFIQGMSEVNGGTHIFI